MKKDPALRHVSLAVRSMDKALASSDDAATRTAVGEARTALAAALTLSVMVGRAARVEEPREWCREAWCRTGADEAEEPQELKGKARATRPYSVSG